jgi:hypothetical protein
MNQISCAGRSLLKFMMNYPKYYEIFAS